MFVHNYNNNIFGRQKLLEELPPEQQQEQQEQEPPPQDSNANTGAPMSSAAEASSATGTGETTVTKAEPTDEEKKKARYLELYREFARDQPKAPDYRNEKAERMGNLIGNVFKMVADSVGVAANAHDVTPYKSGMLEKIGQREEEKRLKYEQEVKETDDYNKRLKLKLEEMRRDDDLAEQKSAAAKQQWEDKLTLEKEQWRDKKELEGRRVAADEERNRLTGIEYGRRLSSSSQAGSGKSENGKDGKVATKPKLYSLKVNNQTYSIDEQDLYNFAKEIAFLKGIPKKLVKVKRVDESGNTYEAYEEVEDTESTIAKLMRSDTGIPEIDVKSIVLNNPDLFEVDENGHLIIKKKQPKSESVYNPWGKGLTFPDGSQKEKSKTPQAGKALTGINLDGL
jgi:hypothetical protein